MRAKVEEKAAKDAGEQIIRKTHPKVTKAGSDDLGAETASTHFCDLDAELYLEFGTTYDDAVIHSRSIGKLTWHPSIGLKAQSARHQWTHPHPNTT